MQNGIANYWRATGVGPTALPLRTAADRSNAHIYGVVNAAMRFRRIIAAVVDIRYGQQSHADWLREQRDQLRFNLRVADDDVPVCKTVLQTIGARQALGQLHCRFGPLPIGAMPTSMVL